MTSFQTFIGRSSVLDFALRKVEDQQMKWLLDNPGAYFLTMTENVVYELTSLTWVIVRTVVWFVAPEGRPLI